MGSRTVKTGHARVPRGAEANAHPCKHCQVGRPPTLAPDICSHFHPTLKSALSKLAQAPPAPQNPPAGRPESAGTWQPGSSQLQPLHGQARPAPPASRTASSCTHTCRTRCRASTNPSAFIPTGAPCPCTSSAMAAPAAARLHGPASRSARGPVAGKGKSLHFRRKGSRDAWCQGSRVCEAGSEHVIAGRSEPGAGPWGRVGGARCQGAVPRGRGAAPPTPVP